MGMWTKKESGPNNGHLSWDFPSSDDDDELDLFTEGQLTGLVRTSYLRYLERSLVKNCEECHASEPNDRDRILERIAQHARILERKALRACMKVDIYQRAMVQIMEQVKKSTKNHLPFVDYKECPTNAVAQIDQETQTDIVEEKPDKQKDLTDFLSNAFGLNPNDPECHMDSTELLNILMSPQDKPNDDSFQFPHVSATIQQSRPMNLDERLQALGLLVDDDNDVTPTTLCSDSNVPMPFLTDNPMPVPFPTDNSVSFLADNPITAPPPEIIPTLQLPQCSWTEELVVQTANLNRILNQLSPFQVAIIEKRFRDLFGTDFQVVEMTDEQKAVCRKRTANLVVAGLTPYYLQKRIATRELFKNLAKSVTDRLMSRSYAPDLATVKKEIKLIFWNKKEFMTLKDIDF